MEGELGKCKENGGSVAEWGDVNSRLHVLLSHGEQRVLTRLGVGEQYTQVTWLIHTTLCCCYCRVYILSVWAKRGRLCRARVGGSCVFMMGLCSKRIDGIKLIQKEAPCKTAAQSCMPVCERLKVV